MSIQNGVICPTCKKVYGIRTGDMPDGTMSVRHTRQSLPGHEGHGTIEIVYNFSAGVYVSLDVAPRGSLCACFCFSMYVFVYFSQSTCEGVYMFVVCLDCSSVGLPFLYCASVHTCFC